MTTYDIKLVWSELERLPKLFLQIR